MSVTMKDVAKAAGVSVMTVSRAFREDSSIRSDTRAAIRAAAEELGYVFDSTAANLRTQRTGFVAVTIPSLNNANFAETVGGLTDVLAGQDLQVLLSATNYDKESEELAIEQLLRRRPEAIVVTGGNHTPRSRRLLEAAGIPVVETWDLPEDPIDRVVGFSNAATMEELVAHLVDQGFQKIAFIGGDATADTRGADRRAGFVRSMTARGLETTRLVQAGPVPISMREGARAMAELLNRHSDTEAVICVSDLSAFGALTECQRMGKSVPDDIAIAGFGAYDIAEICVPQLTTVDPKCREIGIKAAEMITAALNGSAHPDRKVITPKLVASQSTKIRS